MRLILRRIRGTLGNALVWGVGWFIAGCALFLGFTLFDRHSTELSWRLVRFMLQAGVGIGTAGAITGGLFSAFVAANFRNKRLRDVSAARFAMGGTLVTTLVVVTVTYVFSLFSDWPFFLRDLVQPLLTFVPVGAITAFGSIKLAQRELPAHEESARLEGRSEAHIPMPRQPTV